MTWWRRRPVDLVADMTAEWEAMRPAPPPRSPDFVDRMIDLASMNIAAGSGGWCAPSTVDYNLYPLNMDGKPALNIKMDSAWQ